jgi:exopolysaccharide production protein ExoZ
MQIIPQHKENHLGRMRSIEGARGIAALMVVFMHAANLMAVDHFSGHVGLGDIFGFGYVGVDFFFVLSGFIISFIHFNDIGRPAQLSSYLRKRLFRIYPIYWFCLVLTIGILVAGRMALHKDIALGFTSDDIASTIFLLPGAPPQFVDVAWSLQFEIMFYALFALLVASRRLGTLLFLTWFAAILWHLLVMPSSSSYKGFLSAYSLQFLLGVVTGVVTSKNSFAWVGKPLLAMGVGSFALSVYYERVIAVTPHESSGQVLLGLSAAVILFSLVEMEKRKTIRTPQFMYRLGSVSYSVYLVHIVFLNLVYSVLLKLGLYHRLPEVLVYLLAVIIAVTCAAMIGLLVERPLAKQLKRYSSSVVRMESGHLSKVLD